MIADLPSQKELWEMKTETAFMVFYADQGNIFELANAHYYDLVGPDGEATTTEGNEVMSKLET